MSKKSVNAFPDVHLGTVGARGKGMSDPLLGILGVCLASGPTIQVVDVDSREGVGARSIIRINVGNADHGLLGARGPLEADVAHMKLVGGRDTRERRQQLGHGRHSARINGGMLGHEGFAELGVGHIFKGLLWRFVWVDVSRTLLLFIQIWGRVNCF